MSSKEDIVLPKWHNQVSDPSVVANPHTLSYLQLRRQPGRTRTESVECGKSLQELASAVRNAVRLNSVSKIALLIKSRLSNEHSALLAHLLLNGTDK